MNKITIVTAYYEAPKMLSTQLSYWRKYSEDLWNFVEVVIVDDGSPQYPAAQIIEREEKPQFPIQVYRIKRNVPWNLAAARNLAMNNAEGWTVLTDIDHVISGASMIALKYERLDLTKIYIPDRFQVISPVESKRINRHRDSYIIHTDMFWKIGGYDENLTGYWNGAFLPFRKAIRRNAKIVELDSVFLLRFNSDLVSDANVKEWGREGSIYDIKNHPKARERLKQAIINYEPTILQEEWERVL